MNWILDHGRLLFAIIVLGGGFVWLFYYDWKALLISIGITILIVMACAFFVTWLGDHFLI